MDIQRLEKLAVLAGLSLEGMDKERLLQEISALEQLAATLPALAEDEPPPSAAPEHRSPPEIARLDRNLLADAAPAWEEGFYLIPGAPHRGTENG